MAKDLDDRNPLLAHPLVARVARWGLVAWALIGVLVLGYLLFRYALYPVRIIFPPLVVALVFVYLLNPIVSRLERRGIPRVWAALLTYVVFGSLVGLGLRFLIPLIAEQVRGFVASFPSLIGKARATIEQFAGRLDLSLDTEGVLSPQNQEAFIDFLGRILSFARGLFHVALIMILGPILAFYLLVDLPKIQRGLEALVPVRRRPEVGALMRRLGQAVGGFFRGQLLVALFVGIASTLALYIVGLPYWALVGMVAGLFNLIPLIGPWIAGIVAAFIAFTTNTAGEGLLRLAPGWPLAIGSGVGLLIVQQIDNHIISPNIVARTVKLHPVTVMLSLLAGGTLLGLWGMLLAVPTVAAVKVLTLHYWDTRMTWPPASPVERPPPRRPEMIEEAAPGPGRRSRPWFRRLWPGRPAPAPSPEEEAREPEPTP